MEQHHFAYDALGSDGIAVRAASQFLRDQGIRHALGGTAALCMLFEEKRSPVLEFDADFLVERVPYIPPWMTEIQHGASCDEPGGIEPMPGDDNRGASVEIHGLKVDFIPVGAQYAAGAHPVEERAWLDSASLTDGVPVMRVVDALRWKWLAGREKDLTYLSRANYGHRRNFTADELAAMREMSDAATAALALLSRRIQTSPPGLNLDDDTLF